ncbi:MAG: FAD-dependent oxidoreductase, partial [Proteobacteria bacterium]|nr:FAD-dependent oxidoreductase [Pseudomonadota bacterium]
MTRYSIFSLVRNAFGYHRDWPLAWRSPAPKSHYDVVIVGGGGHGLATAYYLAKEHGITNVAVIEKGWLGGGNTGRNTTIIRSNYLWDESAHLYEKALQLYEGLSQDINYNIMLSQRGVLNLAHNLGDMRESRRRYFANRLNGIDSEFLTPAQIKDMVPAINIDPSIRYSVLGASLQRRGGTARHDAVAWGLARAADARGVDIIQNCEVT